MRASMDPAAGPEACPPASLGPMSSPPPVWSMPASAPAATVTPQMRLLLPPAVCVSAVEEGRPGVELDGIKGLAHRRHGESGVLEEAAHVAAHLQFQAGLHGGQDERP